MCGHFKPITTPSTPLIEIEEGEKKPTWKAYQTVERNFSLWELESHLIKTIGQELTITISCAIENAMATQKNKKKQYIALSDLTKDQELKWFSNNDEGIILYLEPNKKIAQTIFLSLVKIAQLISVKNSKELEITAREIQEFGSTGRIEISVNMAEKKVIFEAETTLCESEKIGLVNLHIPAKNHRHVKIPIYNNMGDIIEIPEETIIEYLTTKIEDQLPNTISDFSQLCEYMNLENLDSLQCIQLKILLNNFNDIFVSKNEFGRTDIIQHQIKTEDIMPIKQKA
ncbi:hypothetical protein G9A89_021798 [Geosiphon pyriformis]|nr:hypothetical protein G9A89_021798 [Geosiphon pyriformis]